MYYLLTILAFLNSVGENPVERLNRSVKLLCLLYPICKAILLIDISKFNNSSFAFFIRKFWIYSDIVML